MDMSEFPKTGQRLTISTPHEDDIHNQENQAIPATEEDLEKDELGFTNPNLHRRIRINELQDGKKVYTITEPFTTGRLSQIYETEYPIDEIQYIFISGNRIPDINEQIEFVGTNSFKFVYGHAPGSKKPMEVIYKTTPLLDEEVTYRDYELFISGVHSYRTTKITLHTEKDEGDREHRVYENEIP